MDISLYISFFIYSHTFGEKKHLSLFFHSTVSSLSWSVTKERFAVVTDICTMLSLIKWSFTNELCVPLFLFPLSAFFLTSIGFFSPLFSHPLFLFFQFLIFYVCIDIFFLYFSLRLSLLLKMMPLIKRMVRSSHCLIRPSPSITHPNLFKLACPQRPLLFILYTWQLSYAFDI